MTGESRPVRQFIGCGAAQLEEPADIRDADQLVAGSLGRRGFSELGGGQLFRAVHGFPLAWLSWLPLSSWWLFIGLVS